MRRLIGFLVGLLGLIALFSSTASVQPQAPGFVEQRGGFDVSGPYEVDPNWPQKTWPAPQTPDPADPRPTLNFKRIAEWDGARLVLRTIHGLTNVREVWVLEGNVLRVQRSAQTPGGADSATRSLIYTKGS